MKKVTKEEALEFHESGKPGKLEIALTKPFNTARDLSLAYSPGVAFPCLEIQKDPELAYKYTSKGNFVAIITNGTAVLGLGDIGALAGKPVMEGKAALLKKFAGVDAIDIEVNTKDVEEFIRTVYLIGQTWGGINLEDIKGPECFEIETRLQEMLDIPVFHDDQHGTAIVSLAGLINAAKITGRNFADMKVVVNGAGAAGIACLSIIKAYGLKPENAIICDQKGVIYKGRTENMNKWKEMHAIDTNSRTLTDALKDADVFIGVSAKGAVTQEMVKNMAKNPIIFAMANPDPEILPEEVLAIRPDAIVGTGRSDYPNQVNNVMCFPFLFRGALDARARKITSEMKMAAAKAIAKIAEMPILKEIRDMYPNEKLEFGQHYIIPKPFDSRLFKEVSEAVKNAVVN